MAENTPVDISVPVTGISTAVSCVQELVKGRPTSVPPRYIRSKWHDIKVTGNESSLEVPVIDYSKLVSCANAREMDHELQRLDSACVEWGLILVIDDAKNNKKSLLSAVGLVITMMKEIEVQERAAELAKLESDMGRIQHVQSLGDSVGGSLSFKVLLLYLPPLQMPYNPGSRSLQQLANIWRSNKFVKECLGELEPIVTPILQLNAAT